MVKYCSVLVTIAYCQAMFENQQVESFINDSYLLVVNGKSCSLLVEPEAV